MRQKVTEAQLHHSARDAGKELEMSRVHCSQSVSKRIWQTVEQIGVKVSTIAYVTPVCPFTHHTFLPVGPHQFRDLLHWSEATGDSTRCSCTGHCVWDSKELNTGVPAPYKERHQWCMVRDDNFVCGRLEQECEKLPFKQPDHRLKAESHFSPP